MLCFYPRSPWGERPRNPVKRYCVLSISIRALRGEGDYLLAARRLISMISIHALRGEGDSVRRVQQRGKYISIHALRGEGDIGQLEDKSNDEIISIHALRGEGDQRGPDLPGPR